MVSGLVEGPNLSGESNKIPVNRLGNKCQQLGVVDTMIPPQISTVLFLCPLVKTFFLFIHRDTSWGSDADSCLPCLLSHAGVGLLVYG